MKTSFRWGRLLAWTLMLALLAVIALGVVGWVTLPLDHATISMDGDTLSLSDLDGWRAVLLVAAAFVAVLVAVVVVAAVVVLSLGAAAIAVLVALATVLATLAVVASPALLVIWLVWRALRPNPASRALAA